MPWAKIDDGFHAHRKARRAYKQHRGSLGLHLLAMSYCAGQLTDGLVDVEFVESYLPSEKEMTAVTSALVDSGLWTPEGAGWRINDWLDYNPSRGEVLERRARDAERKAAGRRTQSNGSPKGVRADTTRTPSGLNAESDGPDPYPSSSSKKRESCSPQLVVARDADEGNGPISLEDRRLLDRATLALVEAWELSGAPGVQPKHQDVVRAAHGVDAGVAVAEAELLASEAREGTAGVASSVLGVFRARLAERGAA